MVVKATTPGERIEFLVGNEFATVAVEYVRDYSLLRIRDVRSGLSVLVDPLELEAMTRLTREDFSALVDPSFNGVDSSAPHADTSEMLPPDEVDPFE